MTKELEQLINKIDAKLLSNGLNCIKKCSIRERSCRDGEDLGRHVCDYYGTDEKFKMDGNKNYGVNLLVKETYRGNGTERNRSITIEIIEWKGRSGKMISKVKIYDDYTDKRIESRINKIISIYNKQDVIC